MKITIRNSVINFLAFLGILFGVLQCSALRPDDQFTNKVVAPNFVSELYGTTSHTVSVSHPKGGHISWIGFLQSNDYKYFKVTKIKVGSKTIIEDGMENNGEVFTASSNSLIEDINVDPTTPSSTGFVDGSINVAGSTDMQITIQYSPLIAIESDESPHEAFLIINYDAPNVGSMRVALNGFTKGMKAEKCTQAISTMEAIPYTVTGSAFDLYFCSKEVANKGQNNTVLDSTDPNYRGESTNLTSIPFPDDVITFYQVDDETVCLLTGTEPSINPFVLPIPEGLAPITSMDIAMSEGSFAECSLDAEGKILCDSNILIDALVSLSGFTLTNGSFTADDLKTADCPDFGAISGSGAFGEDEISLIFKGTTLSDINTEEYNIVDALIVAEIKLTL